MRRGQPPARRAGFTLIELLVVVAILAILAALVAAGIGRVRTAAMSNATNQTLTKLQLALDKQWKAVCDECRDHRRTYATPNKHPEFVQMVRLCEDDVDRAEALWMHLNLRRAMPHSLAEATTDIVIAGAKDKAGNVIPTITLKAATTFKDFAGKSSAGEQLDSAALLYRILTQGGRGTNFAIDDAMQGARITVSLGGSPFEAFKDAYGTPIVYRRFYQTADMNSPPFMRSGLTYTDPLDPVGRLKLWSPTGNANKNRTLAEAALFGTQPSGTATTFNGLNKIPTAISAGEDREFEAGLAALGDDAVGYRVGRQGTRGD